MCRSTVACYQASFSVDSISLLANVLARPIADAKGLASAIDKDEFSAETSSRLYKTLLSAVQACFLAIAIFAFDWFAYGEARARLYSAARAKRESQSCAHQLES